MELLALFVVLAATPTVTYDAEALPNKARPPWSSHDIENCSAAVEVHARAEHHIVYKHEDVYACFPNLHRYEDGTLVSGFGTRVRRSHIDNSGGATRRVSRDGGVTWEKADATVPHYNPDAVRADGHLAIANAFGWRYVDEGEMERLESRGPDGARCATGYGGLPQWRPFHGS